MDTSRDDVSIAIRSAFLSKGAKQKFSLFALVLLSIIFIFVETIDAKPLNYLRAFIKDTIYRGSTIVSMPSRFFGSIGHNIGEHINLYKNYNSLKIQNEKLKGNISETDYLKLENTQLRQLIEEEISTPYNYVSARVLLDKQSPYLNSLILNMGSNKGIKNSFAVMHGENFIGRIVDVNFFSSRVLLVTDLNSKIAVITEPSASHAILSGHGEKFPTLEYLPKDHKVKNGDKVYTSGKEGIFPAGIPIGKVNIKNNFINVSLFSDLSQITFANINLDSFGDVE